MLFGQQERFHQFIGANCILCNQQNIGEALPVAPLGEEKLTFSTIFFYKISHFSNVCSTNTLVPDVVGSITVLVDHYQKLKIRFF
jgi:hypothetical protein